MCSLFAESDLFGMMMGIAESFLSLGWIVGPLVGGYLADLAGFAAHAGGDIDKLCHFSFIIPRARRGRNAVCGGAFDDVLCFHRH